jgi:hypothetical protein
MRTMILSLIAFSTCCFLRAEEATVTLVEHGLSFIPLDDKTANDQVILTTSLKVTEKFAPNITVMSQSYNQTLADYDVLSRKQFEQLKIKLLSSEVDAVFVKYEYLMTMEGRKQHHYAKALKRDDRIYLITGTALESQWADVEARIKKSVDSFQLKK